MQARFHAAIKCTAERSLQTLLLIHVCVCVRVCNVASGSSFLSGRSESSLSDSSTTSVASTLSKAVSAESVDYERMILYEHNVSCKPDSNAAIKCTAERSLQTLLLIHVCVCVRVCNVASRSSFLSATVSVYLLCAEHA